MDEIKWPTNAMHSSAHGLTLVPARGAALVRSNQKDQYYAGYLYKMVSELLQKVLRPRTWLTWQREMRLCGELVYFSVTSLLNRQTLGEEYCKIVQTSPRADTFQKYTTPGIFRRMCFILLQVFAPYVLERLLAYLSRCVDPESCTNDESLPWLIRMLSCGQRQTLAKLLNMLSVLVNIAWQFHMATFYWTGSHYHLAKRVAGVHYVEIEQIGARDAIRNQPYEMLGLLMSTQLTLQLAYYCLTLIDRLTPAQHTPVQAVAEDTATTHTEKNSEAMSARGTESAEQEPMATELKCSLCLDSVRNAAALTCGHIFCWDCIVPWCSKHSECPVCRSCVQPRHVIKLQHFTV